MATATLGTGTAYTLTAGETLSYGVTGNYLTSYRFGGARQEVEEFTANGVDGIGTKRHGQRESIVTLSVFAIRGTSGACFTGLIDMIDDLASSGAIQFTVEGKTSIGRIVADQCAVEQPRNNGVGTFRAEAVIVIRRLRSS